MNSKALRLTAAGIGVFTAAAVVAATPALAAHKTTVRSTLATVTSGQALSALSGWDFSTAAGWTPVGAATVGLSTTLGHALPGSLAVTSAGAYTGAESTHVSVVPGDRYLAGGWASALIGGHHVGVALRFYDATGAVISGSTQVGQASVDAVGTWTSLDQVAGIAPANAVTGNVLFLTYDAPAGEGHLLDDATFQHVTGTSAKIAGPLHTSGNHVLDANGRVVTFRGLAISGLERTAANAVPLSTVEVATAKSWGANFVRLPLAENKALVGDCQYDATYLSTVDSMVNAITSRGMVALVDLHTNATTPCGDTVQQNLPDTGAITFWKTVAARYKSNPLVAFDLYNEPHDVSDSVWRNGGTTTTNGVTYTAAGMQQLYNAVRGTGATNLVMASGTNWASDFPSTAPLTGTTNLIYAVHAYTCPNGTPAQGQACNPGPAGIYDPSGILGHFAAISATTPVMVTEFGWPDRNDGVYMSNVISYAQQHGFAGWSAWAFDGTTYNAFDLVKDTGPLNDPTATGMAVMSAFISN